MQALVAAGYRVYPINPMSVARYRERHSTSGAKSDAGDAHVLAEIVRLDRTHRRPIAGDSPQAGAMKLVARTHQTLVWDRSRQLLRLRSTLREFFPAALRAFDDLTHIQDLLRADRLGQPAPVQAAYAAIVTTQVRLITALNIEIEHLGQVVADHFGRHRDADRYLSQPGLGMVLGARLLGEFGDDPHRYTDAKPARTTPAPHPSPAPAAPDASCWPATPATAASPTPSTNEPSAP